MGIEDRRWERPCVLHTAASPISNLGSARQRGPPGYISSSINHSEQPIKQHEFEMLAWGGEGEEERKVVGGEGTAFLVPPSLPFLPYPPVHKA